MPKKAIEVQQDYLVGDGPVRLSVVVGDRQYGSSMVFLDDDLLTNGDIDELPLGEGATLAGRTATVYTIVTDIRDRKAEMSVTWILTGGPEVIKLEKTASTSKGYGSRMFKAELHFTEGD